jgi:hypothetical protein
LSANHIPDGCAALHDKANWYCDCQETQWPSFSHCLSSFLKSLYRSFLPPQSQKRRETFLSAPTTKNFTSTSLPSEFSFTSRSASSERSFCSDHKSTIVSCEVPMRRRKPNAEPKIELELQTVGKFSDNETEQIIEDLASLLISAWEQRKQSTSHEPVTGKESA